MKDAYWFRHDSNARHDPKMIALRAKYGGEGYGVYWMLIETLRDTNGYKFPLKHMPSLCLDFAFSDMGNFIDDCVVEYELLDADAEFFWSPSLLRRMQAYDELKTKRIESGRKGGVAKAERSKSVANAKQNASKPVANAKQTTKQNPSKKVATRLEETREDKKEKNKNTPKKTTAIVLRAEDGTALTTVVMDAMKSKYGEFSNYPLEAKKAQHIVDRAKQLHPERVEEFLKAILGCYWKQTKDGKELKGKAFNPSTLDTEWIWNANYEAFRRQQSQKESVVKEKIF